MPARVKIYVPMEDAAAGTIAELYGPDASGNVDLTNPIAGQRQAFSGAANEEVGPAGLGAQHEPVALTSGATPLVFGVKQFAVKRIDPGSGDADAATPTTFSAFVNAAPVAPSELTIVDDAGDGVHRFTFSGGQVS